MAKQEEKAVSAVEQLLPGPTHLAPRLVINSNVATTAAAEPSHPVSSITNNGALDHRTAPQPNRTATALAPAAALASPSPSAVYPVGVAEGICDAVLGAVLNRMIAECAFDVHRESSLGFLSSTVRSNQDIFGNTKSSVNKLFCQCPVCQRSVGAARFAPHLDKCIQRSSRMKPSRYKDTIAVQVQQTGKSNAANTKAMLCLFLSFTWSVAGKRGASASRSGRSKRGKLAVGADRKGGTARRTDSPVVHTVSNAHLACWTCKSAVKGSDVFICFGCDRASHARYV